MKKIFFILCCIAITAGFSSLKAQTADKYEVSGTLLDKNTGEPLIGANVMYGNAKGTTTDANGNFNLTLPNGDYDLHISYIGYTPIVYTIKVNGVNQVLGNVSMAGSNELDEVEIAADVAKTHETPIAFSDIDAKQISEEMGANDMSMLLNTTPGAYASQQGGGAGDSRITIRGFDQRYVAVLVDGVPVNDMENGSVYWSNWAGLSEVTKKIQVQRGLGATRLAVPSIGGVMNVLTKSVDQKQSFVVRNDLGTNNYRRISVGYNSGLLKNKIGVTIAGSYTGGDGYIDQTWQKTWSFFAKVSYKINDKNLIVASFSGAPQIHAQRSFAINPAYHDRTFAKKQGINADSLYAVPTDPYTNAKAGARGITYSPDWGYINGKPVDTKVNYFYKPLLNISYFLTMNSRMSFSNVLYLSTGKGGGTALASYGSGYDPAGTGQLYMQGIYNANSSAPANAYIPGLRPSTNYIYSSINNHQWVGTLSTFKYKVSSQMDFLGGVDLRYYQGEHYQTPYDYLGGDYVIMPSSGDGSHPSKDLNQAPLSLSPSTWIKRIGDKINYYYTSQVGWAGLFGEMEYKNDKISAFVTVTGNQTGFRIINYFNKKDIKINDNNIIRNAVGVGDTMYYDPNTGKYGVSPTNWNNPAAFTPTVNSDGGLTFYDNMTGKFMTLGPNYKTYTNQSPQARTNTSAVKIYTGYTVKGGLNYKLNRNHNVFANVGYMSVAPKFSNVYDRSGVELQNIKNQLILTGEIGYGIKYRKLAVNVDGYWTRWTNKPLDYGTQFVDPNYQDPIYYNIPGVEAMMKGVEMNVSYKPTTWMEAQAFGMLCDWRWNSGATAYVFSQNGSLLKTVVFDAKGMHVGNAPQRQLGGNVRFNLFKGFYIKPQFIYFDKMYAQFDPTALQVTTGTGAVDYRRRDAWRMPGYGLFDLFAGYTINQRKTTVTITGTMNNVLNTVYMTDATFATATTPNNYNALNAYGWMGLGRRYTVAVKFTF